jgi:hypothetical protein
VPHGIKDTAPFGDFLISVGALAWKGQVVPGCLADDGGLLDERGGRPEFARMQQHADSLSEGQGQRCERSYVARQLEVPGGQVIPALVVPQIMSGVAGDERPAEFSLKGSRSGACHAATRRRRSATASSAIAA